MHACMHVCVHACTSVADLYTYKGPRAFVQVRHFIYTIKGDARATAAGAVAGLATAQIGERRGRSSRWGGVHGCPDRIEQPEGKERNGGVAVVDRST